MMNKEIIDLFKGFYPYFFWLAVIGISLRIFRREWEKKETLLLIFYLAFIAMIALQPFLFYGELSITRRYLLIATPLYLGWSAYVLQYSYTYVNFLKNKTVLVLLIGGIIIFMLIDAAMPVIKDFTSKKKDLRITILLISEIIKTDWGDNDGTAIPILKCDFYRSPKRPLIQSDFKNLSYLSGGQTYEQRAFVSGTIPDYIVISNPGIQQKNTGYEEIANLKIGTKNYMILRSNKFDRKIKK